MSSSSLVELAAQIEQGRHALLEVGVALRNARRRRARLQAAASNTEKLTRGVLSMAVLVYVLASHEISVAVSYVVMQEERRRRSLPSRTKEVIQSTIEEAYVNTPIDKLVALLDEPAGLVSQRRLAAAARHVVEYRLFEWLLSQNCQKGVAPSSRHLLAQALVCIPSDAPISVKEALRRQFAVVDRASRKWLAKFRCRWGARVGKMKIRFDMDTTEIREKAGSLNTLYVSVPNRLHLCFPGPSNGLIWRRMSGPRFGLNSGPHKKSSLLFTPLSFRGP